MSANCRSLIQCIDVDRDAVHFRDRRIGAADREQRQQREIAEQRGERVSSFIALHPPGERDAERRQHEEDVRQRPMHDGNADESEMREDRRRIPSLQKHRRRHLGDHWRSADRRLRR